MTRDMQVFLHSIGIALFLTAFTYFVSFAVGWTKLDETSWFEIGAVFTSYSCTYLCTRQSRWNYPMGILATFLYSLFYWFAEVPSPALAVFNLYLVFSLMFGFWRWGPNGNPRAVSTVETQWWVGYAGFALAIASLLFTAIQFGAVVSSWEIAIVVGSGVAQLLLDNKKIETWAVWIVVNVVSIYFYWEAQWYLAMFQYVFFLANAFWGWYEWNKSRQATLRAEQFVGVVV